jgi:hypothetical protein
MKLDPEQFQRSFRRPRSMLRDLTTPVEAQHRDQAAQAVPGKRLLQVSRFMPTRPLFALPQMMSGLHAGICMRGNDGKSSASSAINLSWAVTACTFQSLMRSMDAPQADSFPRAGKPAVEMIGAVDHGLAFGGEPRSPATPRRADPSPSRARRAAGRYPRGGGLAVEMVARRTAPVLTCMKRFEDRLGDARRAWRRPSAPSAGPQMVGKPGNGAVEIVTGMIRRRCGQHECLHC